MIKSRSPDPESQGARSCWSQVGVALGFAVFRVRMRTTAPLSADRPWRSPSRFCADTSAGHIGLHRRPNVDGGTVALGVEPVDELSADRAIAGFERPDSLRLEGVAPFGPPAFILAGRGDTATLLLPRDNRVLRDARAADILGALTGVALAPEDLQGVLTGCVASIPGAMGGRLHQNGWASIDLPDGATLYLKRIGAGWQPRAARRPGWRIDYPEWQDAFPHTVRLRSADPMVDVDLTAAVSQLEAGVTIAPAAFTVAVPADALPITIAELRNAGPLRGR